VRLGPDQDMGEVERGRGRRAGVLDVEDRRVPEACAVERGLTADAMLALERPLSGVGEDNCLGLPRRSVRVGERFRGGPCRQFA
jgi:hypothetical protein